MIVELFDYRRKVSVVLARKCFTTFTRVVMIAKLASLWAQRSVDDGPQVAGPLHLYCYTGPSRQLCSHVPLPQDLMVISHHLSFATTTPSRHILLDTITQRRLPHESSLQPHPSLHHGFTFAACPFSIPCDLSCTRSRAQTHRPYTEHNPRHEPALPSSSDPAHRVRKYR